MAGYGQRLREQARRLWRLLLWRVSRRLAITYLLAGLTPILLLALFGLVAALGGSAEEMARIVTVQMDAMIEQSEARAEDLVAQYGRLPRDADDRAVAAWLEETAAVLQGVLPGAKVALWRPGAGEMVVPGDGVATFVTGVPGPRSMVNTQEAEVAPALGAPLPAWLRSEQDWRGLVWIESAAGSEGGSASLRALERGDAIARPIAIMLEVPVEPALVELLRRNLRIHVRPSPPVTGGPRPRATNARGFVIEMGDRLEPAVDLSGWLAGVPLHQVIYSVVMPVTGWRSGERSRRDLFTMRVPAGEAVALVLGTTLAGRGWRRALAAVLAAFVGLEILALLAAVEVTRAVTGTVNELSAATTYVRRGDFSHRTRPVSHDQLGDLAEAFNQMSGDLGVLLKERVERERLQKEMEIAAGVQAALFPGAPPQLASAEIAARCRAARGVAGDYYDYVDAGDGRVLLAVGDVAGKGISAALLMSNLQAATRAQAVVLAATPEPEGPRRLAAIVASINRQLCRSTEPNRFATLFIGLYDDRTRRLRYTNAGHNAPRLVRAGGGALRLREGGVMVGSFEDAAYGEGSVDLEPGDVLVLFSDGISEAHDAAGQEFGEEGVVTAVTRFRASSATAIRDGIFQVIDARSGGSEQDDDQTLLIVKATGLSSPS